MLEEQLALSNQKAQFFEAVVDVLKNDYGLSVVKKRPGKSSRKKRIQNLSISKACQFMGISRQAYYKRNRADAARLILDEKVADFVQQKRLRQPRLDTRKLYYLLQCQPQHELQVSRDRLFAILRERRLLVARKRAYHKTTDSHHRFRRHPNLLKPGPYQVVPSGPEQVWVADITYLPTQEGVAYLSLVTDAFSRKIVGYHVHESLHTASVAQPLIHHSDRGSRYCSGMYQELHAKHGIRYPVFDDGRLRLLSKRPGRAGQWDIEDRAFAPATTRFNAGKEDGE